MAERICFIDTETWNEAVDIKAGTDAYARTCELMLTAWKLPGQDTRIWDRTAGLAIPQDLLDLLRDPEVVFVAHNAAFDRQVLHHTLKLPLNPDRWMCSMAKAYTCSLQGSLDKVGAILGLSEDQAKDKDGHQLVLKFCKPAPKNHKVRRYTRENSPEDWQRFMDYCVRDVEAMERIWDKLPGWNYRGAELALWRLDQRINDRGIQIDLELVRAAIRASDKEKARFKLVTQEASDGAVGSFTQRDILLRYLNETYELELPDLTTSTLETVLERVDLPRALEDLVRARLNGSKTSTAKYKRLIQATGPDGRIRGTLQFAGASRTGRWSHKLMQPGNMPRPNLKQADIELGIEALKGDWADFLYGDQVMELCSSAIRGTIIAPEGKRLFDSDLSNIEGRILAWLAGESWKVRAFRDYDTILLDLDGMIMRDAKGEPRRLGHDLYVLAYSGSFGIKPEEVAKDQRQIGKVQELALGYEGGVGAFVTFALAYNIDLDAMADKAWDTLPEWALKASARAWDWAVENKMTYGLSERAYRACDCFKRMWRGAHPNVTALWEELGEAVRNAIKTPKLAINVRGKLKVRYEGNWLAIRLPSGRALLYCNPELRTDKGREVITYMGINQFNRKWQRLKTYGGKLCIAAGTPVLTSTGWKPIERVSAADRVWDGLDWVLTGGAVVKGAKPVVHAHGAWLTPDHEILTEKGWRRASQSEGYNRAACRLPDGCVVPRVEWETISLADQVRLWGPGSYERLRLSEIEAAGCHSLVWVQTAGDDKHSPHEARDVETPHVRGVAQHGGPLPTSVTSRLAQLWRSGDQGVRALGRVLRGILGRHGAYLPTGPDAGSDQQRRGVRAGELPVGHLQGAGEQQAIFAAVFDLLDCGPRHRFVIATPEGPLIVHNCENTVQAIARDVLAANMPRIEDAGYEIVLTVHDEVVSEAPDTPEFTHERLSQLLATNPEWAPDLPLAAGGFSALRFRKD